MSVPISPYLLPYLKTADQLPDLLAHDPPDVVQALQARIRTLVQLVAVRDETVRKLQARLDAEFGKDEDAVLTVAGEPPRDEDR